MDPNMLCPGKGFVLPKTYDDEIAANSRYLLIFLTNNDMSKKSPFAIHKALTEIGGEPTSVKLLRFGDLLIETISALQTKSFLIAKSFPNSLVTISPHKSVNFCRGVISEPDLLNTPEAEILHGFSDPSVVQTITPGVGPVCLGQRQAGCKRSPVLLFTDTMTMGEQRVFIRKYDRCSIH
ncbi:uncharacterized protein TNCV_2963341 [Trichonephila clavipes]|nr:uncharacterized protein TNCV_2963341 [Trichonephila clavipes]